MKQSRESKWQKMWKIKAKVYFFYLKQKKPTWFPLKLSHYASNESFGSHQNNVAHFCHHFLLHYLIGLISSSSSLREFPQIRSQVLQYFLYCRTWDLNVAFKIFLSSYLLLLLLIHGKGVLSHSLFIGSNHLHFPLPLPLLLIDLPFLCKYTTGM